MLGRRAGLLGREERSADLHGLGPERERRRHAPCIGDPTGRDHRCADLLDDAGTSAIVPTSESSASAQEGTPVAAGLHARRDDHVDARFVERHGLIDGDRCPDRDDPTLAEGIE